jgi:hypothetical protein
MPRTCVLVVVALSRSLGVAHGEMEFHVVFGLVDITLVVEKIVVV